MHVLRPPLRASFGAALVTLAASVAAGVTPAKASGAQELGLNVHQSTSVGLDATHDAGLRWVRIDLNWLDAQPTPGPPDFALFDAIVDGANARDLAVLAVVGYGPAWASSGDTRGDGNVNDVPQEGTYAAFVTQVVEHFKGRVTHYELWNEPNLSDFFEGGPAQYVDRVLVPGAAAVHAACSECKVVAPGLASVGGEYDVWLDASLAAAKDQIDIVSGHAYAGFPQDEPGAGTSSDSFFNKIEQHRVLMVGDTVVFEGPLSFREVMAKHGVTGKPFWITETGQEATLGDAASEAAQRLHYRRVLEAMLTRSWWTTTIFYEAFDVPGSGYTWGVVVQDDASPAGYVPKQVMGLLQKATAAQPAFGGSGTDCDDGLDNEGDGFVDYPADPDCASAAASSEGLPPPPDAGAGGAAGGGANGAAGGGNAGGAGAGAGATSPEGAAAGGDDGGCGCRVAGSRDARGPRAPAPDGLIAVAAGAALALRRASRKALGTVARRPHPPAPDSPTRPIAHGGAAMPGGEA